MEDCQQVIVVVFTLTKEIICIVIWLKCEDFNIFDKGRTSALILVFLCTSIQIVTILHAKVLNTFGTYKYYPLAHVDNI